MLQPLPTALPVSIHRRKRRLIVVALVIVALAAGGFWYFRAPERPPLPPEIQFESGADEQVIAAVSRARLAVLADPRSANAWGELGMVFGAHGYEPEANTCFAEAERLGPADARWPYYQGVFAAVHDPKAARDLFRRALAAGAPSPEIRSVMRLRMAEALLASGDLDGADSIFRDEKKRDPNDPRATFGCAQVELARGNRSAAKALLLEIESNPFVRQRSAILLAALARESADPRAAEFAEKASQLPADPSWPDPYLVQLRSREVGLQGLLTEAESLEAAGQLGEAAKMLVDLAESHPLPRVLVAAGVVLAKLRDYSHAERLLRRCLAQEPRHIQANYFLAVVLFEQAVQPNSGLQAVTRRALLAEAVTHAQEAVAGKPDHGLAWLYMGRARLELGEIAQAITALEQAVACRPEIADTQLYLAEALAANGDLQPALSHARMAQKLCSPHDPRAARLIERLSPKKPQGER